MSAPASSTRAAPRINVRGIGLFGRGLDPLQECAGMDNPADAAALLRQAEAERPRRSATSCRLGQQRAHPRRGPGYGARPPGRRGFTVGFSAAAWRVSVSRPVLGRDGHPLLDEQGKSSGRTGDTVQGIVLMRKNEHTLPSLERSRRRLTS